MKRQREEILNELRAKKTKLQKIESEENEVKSDIKQLKYELNSLIGINRFPFEVMNMILKRLKATNLFECELVCRRWNAFVRAFRKPELIISQLNEEKPRRWKFSQKICAKKSTIIRSGLHFDNVENSLLIGLKRLKLINHKLAYQSTTKYDQIPLLNDLDFINKLVNLETLELKSIDIEDEASLTLPNLRCLAVSRLFSKLKLATPELTNYQGRSLVLVEFVFKEKLTHLCVDTYSSSIEQLKNLQYLCIKNHGFSKETSSTSNDSQSSDDSQPSESQSSSDQFLDNHPNLKELSIRPAFNYLDKKAYESAKSSALRILDQKKRLKRDEFKLIFFGIQLEDVEQLEDFKYYKDNLARLHILNYSSLCTKELRWVKRVNLPSLLQCVSSGLVESIPSDFYEKFGQVEEIVIGCDITEEQIDILKKFKRLNSLIVRGERSQNSIEPSIFEKMAEALPAIWSLELEDLPDYDSDLDFVFKFKKLRRLLTKCYYYDAFLAKFLEKFDVFEVSFMENGTNLKAIKRGKNSKLELWCGDGYDWSFHMDFDHYSDFHEEVYRSFAD